MRVLFIGDVVGPPGVDLLRKYLPSLIVAENIELTIANAENANGGSGMTPRTYRQLRQAGVDLATMGDHVYKKLDILEAFKSDDRICRPANFPEEAPGRSYVLAPGSNGALVAAFCVLGRTFMRPVDCPFKAADRMLAQIGERTRCIFVDIHAEATADKILMAHHLRGKVTAVLGTHTHVQTADERILPGGTAFISDVGMTGPHDSILGRRIDRVLPTTISFVPTAFDVAEGDPRISGAIVDVDDVGRAVGIRRVHVTEGQLAALPQAATPK
jgi:metallophosphoesterase (TIGR00282 family)